MAYQRTSKTGIDPACIKRSELYGKLTKAVGEAQPYPDVEIQRHIFVAEDYYERNLSIKWQPTRVFSNPQLRNLSPDSAVRVPDYDPLNDVEEAAYDYELGMFEGNRWSQIQLGYRPVRGLITRMFWWYPGSVIGSSWQVDIQWLRVDSKFGVVQIVPASGPLLPMLSLNTYVLGALAGGRSIPQSIFIDYTVGFTQEELQHSHQDLLEGVRLYTLLSMFGILSTIVSQGKSGTSLSMDGLSRSSSFGGKWGGFSGEIDLALQREEQIRDNWRQHEQGPTISFA